MMLKQFIGLLLVMQISAAVYADDVAPDSPMIDKGKSTILAGEGLSDPNIAGSLIQTTLGLLVVLAVIAAAAWAFKRFGHFQTGAQGKMKVVGGVSLGSRERAVLLQVGEQQLVVGVSPGRLQTLHVLDKALPIGNEVADSPSFSDRLHTAMANRVGGVTTGKNSARKDSVGENYDEERKS